MINLSQETETLAVRLAAAQRLSVEATIRQALEAQARAAGYDLRVGHDEVQESRICGKQSTSRNK